MKKIHGEMLLFLVAALSLFPAVASAVDIVSITTCSKVAEPGTIPINATDKFGPETPEIHLVLEIKNVRDGVTMVSKWISIDAVETPNVEVASSKPTLKSSYKKAHFSLTKPEGGNWSAGNYKVEVYEGKQLITSVPYIITAASAPQNQAQGGWGAPPPKPAPGGLGAAQKRKPTPAETASTALTGDWQCTSMLGASTLSFASDSRLVMDGQSYSYSLGQDVIHIQGMLGVSDYSYQLSGNDLLLVYPIGLKLQCRKSDGGVASGRPGYGGGQPGVSGGGAGRAQTSGQERQLRGTLCSYSGSSSSYGSYSSYSTTKWAKFDGQGRFTYGSESSFQSSDGIYANPGGSQGGRYKVNGDRVQLFYDEGGSDFATVSMRQNSGQITELKYGGDLYATSLCQ
jgi:hypothetical protein